MLWLAARKDQLCGWVGCSHTDVDQMSAQAFDQLEIAHPGPGRVVSRLWIEPEIFDEIRAEAGQCRTTTNQVAMEAIKHGAVLHDRLLRERAAISAGGLQGLPLSVGTSGIG